MRHIIYEVVGTNIVVENHNEAVAYYRQGHAIDVLVSKDGIQWEKVLQWTR